MPLIAARVAFAVALLTAVLTPALARAADSTCAAAYENAQILRQRGELIAARDAALVCAQAACPGVARRDCAAWAGELEREIPSIIVIARDEASGDEGGARILVDGAPRADAASGRAFALDPGAHVFRIERAGNEPFEQTVTIVRGDRERILRFALRREQTPAQAAVPVAPAPSNAVAPSGTSPEARTLWPGAIAGVGAAAALGVSAWLGVTGRNELDDLRGTCAPACSDGDVDPVRTKLIASDIALGVGIVGAAVAIYLLVHPPAASSRPARAAVVGTF
jgi:hypothetical protein